MRAVDTWTIAKAAQPDKNEDVSQHTDTVLVLADGETDKAGVQYPSGESGGKSLAEIAAATAKSSDKNGYELADEVSRAVQAFYTENNPEALTDASKRAATTLVVARIQGRQLIVTQIGDTNVRLTYSDGTRKTLTNDKLVDTVNAARRAAYITDRLAEFEHEHGRQPQAGERDSIVADGRKAIQQRLNNQYKLWNSSVDNELGYGVIDGTEVPQVFTNGEPTNYVQTYTFALKDVSEIELVSDGFYGEFPSTSDIASYRLLYDRIHNVDPDKFLRYKSTKTKDDATVVRAIL